MRFIKKEIIPNVLTEWHDRRVFQGLDTLYSKFGHKEELNDILRKEQHHICCYCQRQLTHFGDPWLKGSRNEHLYPENLPGDTASVTLQTDYSNLFACCIDSQGHKQYEAYLRYCDVAKENKVIRGFIQEKTCSSYFRYNLKGEIVPNGQYYTWREYQAATDLSQDLLDAVKCIEILNLNCITLVAERKLYVENVVKFLREKSADEIRLQITHWKQDEYYIPYIEMAVQFAEKMIDSKK